MTTGRVINGWVIIAVLLVFVIIIGGIFLGLNYGGSGPVEISLAPPTDTTREIYIGGDVNNPGYYDLHEDDDVEDLIAAAGGITGDGESSEIQLNVSRNNDEELSQLININTAEAWLLESLTGIGAVKAQAIVEYREQNGRFQNIQEITEVEGIGPASFEQIKLLITVAE